jgi:4-oxalocrotonate tautomerase
VFTAHHLISTSLKYDLMPFSNGQLQTTSPPSNDLRETEMPLAQISLRRGKPAAYRHAIGEAVYRALRETFDVPEGDRFITVTEHDDDNFVYGPDYLGIHRSDDLVIIQLTVSNTRPLAKKQALYGRIVARLGDNPGLRSEDVFINLVEVLPENWSFGMGEAQYVKPPAERLPGAWHA